MPCHKAAMHMPPQQEVAFQCHECNRNLPPGALEGWQRTNPAFATSFSPSYISPQQRCGLSTSQYCGPRSQRSAASPNTPPPHVPNTQFTPFPHPIGAEGSRLSPSVRKSNSFTCRSKTISEGQHLSTAQLGPASMMLVQFGVWSWAEHTMRGTGGQLRHREAHPPTEID